MLLSAVIDASEEAKRLLIKVEVRCSEKVDEKWGVYQESSISRVIALKII
jgi:hypothetical protein